MDIAGGGTVRLALSQVWDRTPYEGAALPVTLEVKDGAVRFVNSVCPDHICENTGWLRLEGEAAVCAPAGFPSRWNRPADGRSGKKRRPAQ